MLNSDHKYALELYRGDGVLLGQASVPVDWSPAAEWVLFEGLRRGRPWPSGSSAGGGVRPLWHPRLGEPYLSGFRVTLVAGDGRDVSGDFTTAYFQDFADRAALVLAEHHQLAAEDSVKYLATATPCAAQAPAAPSSGLRAVEVAPAVALRDGSLRGALAAAQWSGPAPDGGIPVFIPDDVLSEISDRTQIAGGRETGGVLIGALCRDPEALEVFAVVTGQIPATLAVAAADSLIFTAEAWEEVRAARALRGGNEIYCGWWHAHPVHEWCRRCPVEKRRLCPRANVFSANDQALHRAVFPRAFSVALVVNALAPEEHTFSLYGWREGRIHERGFHLTAAAPPHDLARGDVDAQTAARRQ